jgi:hypothetical protein
MASRVPLSFQDKAKIQRSKVISACFSFIYLTSSTFPLISTMPHGVSAFTLYTKLPGCWGIPFNLPSQQSVDDLVLNTNCPTGCTPKSSAQ